MLCSVARVQSLLSTQQIITCFPASTFYADSILTLPATASPAVSLHTRLRSLVLGGLPKSSTVHYQLTESMHC